MIRGSYGVADGALGVGPRELKLAARGANSAIRNPQTLDPSLALRALISNPHFAIRTRLDACKDFPPYTTGRAAVSLTLSQTGFAADFGYVR